MNRSLKLLAIPAIFIFAYWVVPLVWNQGSVSDERLAFVEEAASPLYSSHRSWWVQSGGAMIAEGDGWKTFQGELKRESKWRRHYLRANPLDTDNGYHPQNIFRMLSREEFGEPVQELNFKITNINLSASPNRNAESGAFLYARYVNPSNYYYAGFTMDGKAIIRKKTNGVFETLAEMKIFDGEYDAETNPILIPIQESLGLQFDITEEEGGVRLTLLVSREGGEWEKAVEFVDRGYTLGPAHKSGKVGIRTDFMDVVFTNYLVRE